MSRYTHFASWPAVGMLTGRLPGSDVRSTYSYDVTATTMGLLRTMRRTTSASARLGTSLVATSDDLVMVEGNAYFPRPSVAEGVLQSSSTTSVCPWKGVASYYDVHVDGQVVPDGAFTHRHPSPLARRIKGRVAFWKEIEIDTSGPRSD